MLPMKTFARFAAVTVFAVLALAGCSTEECSEQSCADYGGTASRTFQSCYSSGTGSVDDEFVLRDNNGDAFYTCTRPADDNNGCGVELLQAKGAYCAGGGGGSGSGGGGGGSGSGSATDEQESQ